MDAGKGGRGIEEVLTIVQIQDGIAPRGVLVEAGRRPDAHEARVCEHAAAKAMDAQIAPDDGVAKFGASECESSKYRP